MCCTQLWNPELRPWAHAQEQHLDLGGCGSLSALITLEEKFGARAFQLLGYTKPCEGCVADAPLGTRRLAGGWCRSSEKSAGHVTASMVRVCPIGFRVSSLSLSHCVHARRQSWLPS